MNDTIKYLPESRALFRKFMKARFKDFWEITKNARVGPGSGYWFFYRDNEVIQHIRDITHNLEETFGDVSIPEEFSSPRQLVKSWNWFHTFLKSRESLFEDVIKTTESTQKVLPEPFWWIRQKHIDILELMDEIMNMEEVKKYLDEQADTDKNLPNNEIYEFQIVIITALYDTEFEAIKKLPISLEPYKSKHDNTNYYQSKIGSKSVLFATDDKMGMAAAAALSTKLIAKFSPEYIIMAGIAAGVKDKEKNYGDILVCRSTWNYESGKYRYTRKYKKTIFEPNPEQIELESALVHIINDLKSDKTILEKIRTSFCPGKNDKQPEQELKVYMGPMASGSAVVADEKKIVSIRRKNRKLIGIDMETFGVYYASKSYANDNSTKAISIKSISDFADQCKSDAYRNFAAHTSAHFIYQLILKGLQ